ncbi:acyl-CoA N-acyltransferase [Auriscalpium vulgare]|uniref:Acyl-CoA N-acyltransferase n=1 Tax=Auriscalpium vulgare TaxID=40419 RepID=A0ACB8RMC5_9AGAM|nr:acyl-CoA N-acyltransferase [Auriscalpium vulgare]
MTLAIRRAVPADAPALEQICLRTGDAGADASALLAHGELLGLVWALPYVLLAPPAARIWGFVLADPARPDDHTTTAVKGYILGTADTRAYERAAGDAWWPPLRQQFPLAPPEGEVRSELEKWYVELLHKAPDPAREECIAFSPAHMHIDLLPEVQRQGWGRRLVDAAVQHLRTEGVDGLWLGMDKRNVEARKFYLKLGYEGIDGLPDEYVGLKFANWKDA